MECTRHFLFTCGFNEPLLHYFTLIVNMPGKAMKTHVGTGGEAPRIFFVGINPSLDMRLNGP
jgi:hypothetical protein